MDTPKDDREVKCYLCEKKLFSVRHAYEGFYALCEKCLNGLEKQESALVGRLNRELEKMRQSKHFKHSSEK